MKNVLLIMSACMLAIVVSWPSHAQKMSPSGPPGGSQIRLFEAWAIFPFPSWQKSDNALSESRLSRHQEAQTFTLTMVPKSETFNKWTQQYTLLGYWNENISLRKFMNGSIAVLVKACGRENVKLRKILKKDAARLVAIYCFNTPRGPAKFGYGDGVGEITLMWMGRLENTYAKIFQQWRGSNFSVNDPTTWPVLPAELDKSIARFAGIQLKPYAP